MMQPRSEAVLRRAMEACAAAVIAAACFAWLCWAMGRSQIAAFGAAHVPMAPSTALLFILLGTALFLHSRFPASRISRLLQLASVSAVLLVSSLVCAKYLFQLEWPVERWLAGNAGAIGGVRLGVMSPFTAMSFLFLAIAFSSHLPLLARRIDANAGLGLATIVLLFSLMVLLAYATGTPLFFSGKIAPIAVLTAVSFAALSAGLMAACTLVRLHDSRWLQKQLATGLALRESEEKFRSISTLAQDAVIMMDNAGRIVFWNAAATRMFGHACEDAVGKNLHELIVPTRYHQAHREAMAGFQKTGCGQAIGKLVELEGLRKDGQEFPLEMSLASVRQGDQWHAVGILRDITERKRSEQLLRESNARLQHLHVELNAAAASIKNLMDDVVDRHDFDGRFENPLLGRCWAIKNCGATECPCHQNESNLRCWEISGTFCRAKSGGTFARRLEDCRKCEVYQQARTHAVVDLGETFNTMMAILAEREGELRAAATTDKLTGLPNRALLLDRLQQVVVRHRRWNVPGYAVLFLDFDRFKIVNDSLGHDTGDQLLREIARKLQDALRSSDSVSFPAQTATAARLGGDEFVVLLDCLRHPDDARTVAERILNALSLPFKLGNHDIVSTASIGIVTSDCRHDRAEDVLRDADTAMYEAKLAGRGRAMVFDASMRDRVKRKLELENALRKAIETGQFLLHYQPIVSLETGKTEGLEALLRWQHPEHGLISPGEFIPIAEETDLIVPLGEWVAREAFRQLAEWRRLYGREQVPSISINLSRRQLAVPDLPQQLRSIAADAGIEPAAIHLEVTESAIMADTEAATCVLREMKSIGFKVDMDDFGTGYSSLAALQQFPIDVIKIDRSFIANLDRGRDYAALVHAVITLARNLNIDVVAEGVETASQLAALQALECRSAQGYFFARPMPADQAVNDWRCIHPIKTDGVRADSAA